MCWDSAPVVLFARLSSSWILKRSMDARRQTQAGRGRIEMSTTTSSWQHRLRRRLRRRNAAEIDPFELLIENYGQMSRQQQALVQRVEKQEKELVILRHEAAMAAAGGGGAAAEETRDEKLLKLQRKVQRLQEELTDKLRLEVQGATSQLNLTKEIQDLFQKWQAARAEADALKSELEGFKNRERDLVARAALAQTDLDTVQGELKRVQAMLEAAEAERTALRVQNDELVQRVVGEKSRNAEEMNRMTELVEKMRGQLRLHGVNVGSLGSGGGGSGGGGGGGGGGTTVGRNPPGQEAAAKQEVPTQCALQFKAHAADVNDVVFSDTGQLLATAGSDGKVRVWEAGTGRLRHTLAGQDVMLGLDVRGDLVACGSSDASCKLWSLSSGRAHRTLVGHSGNVYAVRLLGGDGRSVLTGAADRTVRLWDVGRASCRQVLRSGSTCNGLDVGVDGNLPVSAHQDGGLRLWDLRSGNPTMIIRAFETQATSVAYGSGFTVLANSRDNVIKVLDTRTYETLHTLRHEEYRTFLNWSRACFSPANTHVSAASAGGALLVWELSSGEVKASLTASSPDSTAADALSASSGSGSAGGLTNCAWSRAGGGGVGGGTRVAACSKGGMVFLWT